ncbi:MAG: metallophosphoesterase [Lachnospiraceae bacterium]|nr:metallophosphoesterase [Lachnospiraceae bacterium]
MKKTVLSLGIMLVFLFVFVTPAQAAGQTLRAREDGSFRILIVTDTQDTDNPRQLMLDLLKAELDTADADLVILLGDNIYGRYIGVDATKVRAAIDAIMEPIAERELPFVVAFGNHDDEKSLSKEEQLEMYKSYPGCLNDDPDISGVGNTCLPFCDVTGNEVKALLWVIDSGTYANEDIGGYDYVKEDQINWLKTGVAEYSSEIIPASYVFQHIPVPQVYSLLSPAKPFEKGAVSAVFNPFSDWYTQNNDAISAGSFGETPCPPKIDSGEFQAWKECGVRAAFFGHDHLNDYVGCVEGIDLIATSGIGFYDYGDGDEHGARILVLHADRPEEYETEMLYYRDLFDTPLSPFDLSHIGIEAFRIIVSALGIIIISILILMFIIKKRKVSV